MEEKYSDESFKTHGEDPGVPHEELDQVLPVKKAYIPPEIIQHKPLKSIMSEKAFAKAT
jgi:hypothetical protein